MRLTAIDIGTNTILMLVADVARDGQMTVIRDEHQIARLGKGVDAQKRIAQETIDRVLSILEPMKEASDALRSERVAACGTSALRDAANRDEVVNKIEKKIGVRIRTLSGEEEASLTYWGTVTGFRSQRTPDRFGVIDIGGGSTEIVCGNGRKIFERTSVNVGCVRLTERILKSSPPSDRAIADARNEVEKALIVLGPGNRDGMWIGVAGTLTTLAALDLRLPSYDRRRVEGHVLSLQRIRSMFDELRSKDLEQIRAYPQILPLRADILVAGIIVLIGTMERLGIGEIAVSDRGLRYGILLESAAPDAGGVSGLV